jgi:hypothetical protein
MASTSVTNATVGARATSDGDDGGNLFGFDRAKATLVAHGPDDRWPLDRGTCSDDTATTARP